MSITIQSRGVAITEDDATIAAALEEASIPALMMSMIHMSGDTSLLQGSIRPLGVYLNEVQGYMSEQDKATIRARALEIIRDYRNRGCTLPPMPSAETLREMMCFLVAGDVPAEYVPMMMEEMELEGEDARSFHWDHPPAPEALANFHVVVIGGGMSGVLSAIRLKEAGIPFTVFEKNPCVGGTWYENRYPGCRVDVGNHFYCYSFEPNHDWTEFFARQAELQAYFERCLDTYDLRSHFRFNTEVTTAVFDEVHNRWAVRVKDSEGRESELQANALISAVGQLNRPKWPDIPGRERFRGTTCHTAQWPAGLDLTGKRVAVIGTGASAFQLVPAIAGDVEKLTVFQRSAPWMFPNPDYHRKVGEGAKWLMKHLPFYARWYRFLLFWPACDGLLPSLRIDPAWPHQQNSINETNELVRQVFTDWISEQVGDDPELLAKVIPDYVPLAKRTLQDNGSWLAALKRDNVDLITSGIREITEDAVITTDGTRYPVDVIVFATGFHANRFLWPMDIVGRNGVHLSEHWGEDPEAYLGITVPHFPNLFCLYGPGTNLAHGGSLIFHSECEIRYILGCLKLMLEQGHGFIECRQEVCDTYNQQLSDTLSHMVWAHPSVKHSWYQNNRGRVTVLSPWRLLDFWQWTRTPKPQDYRLG